jgi:Ca2+-binding EF-hand superfamily protein
MRKLTFSIALATLATAAVAVAAPQIAGHGPKGDVTRAQVEATAAEHFAKMDVNGDGKLDAADRTAMQAKMFDRIDTDHNGAINREEFAARHGQRGEGARQARQGGERGHRMGGRHMRGHHGGMHGGGMGMAKAADTNNDGAITKAEFTAGALKMFDAADADDNGTVTQAERKAGFNAMKAKWQARSAGAPAATPAS